MNDPVIILWFRRDLRINDNTALYYALRSGLPVIPLFIFDSDILLQLEDKNDRRVNFIYNKVNSLRELFEVQGSAFEVHYGKPYIVFEKLITKYNISAVYTNDDYEPYATTRDNEINELLNKSGISFRKYKDHVIFEKKEVSKDDGTPYSVFTPYSRKWKSLLTNASTEPFPSETLLYRLLQQIPLPFPSLKEIGFNECPEINVPDVDIELITFYEKTRDIPGIHGTSRLGVHLRFGTVSIRELVSIAIKHSPVFLNELIWREFYQMILWHNPRLAKGASFKPVYDNIEWRNNEDEINRWCEGNTGYPIVDAGMRELNDTGFMHNRVRMITASFLCKHLLADWRIGESYFASRLLDYEFASNNGGWQWASGSGCDAAPYFRIFNPYLQTKKFDPQLTYIKKWVPEFQEFSYPEAIVNHEFARARCLEVYSKGLNSNR